MASLGTLLMFLATVVVELAALAFVPATPASAVPLPVTAYVTNFGDSTVTPITVATNTPGSPISVGNGQAGNGADGVAITPDGRTAYVTNEFDGTVTPITVATNTPGLPIPVGTGPRGVAITPDNTTAYVVNGSDGTVTPIAVATNTPGNPIPVGNAPIGIAITPAPRATPTSTQLSIDPPSPAAAGTTETLTATIAPSAAGNVQFTDGTTNIGSPVTVTNGSASMTTTLAPGIHSLTAVFTPTDPAAFSSSTSNTVTYVINAPSEAKATTITLRVVPNRTFEGFPVIVLAKVVPRAATGTVQFMDRTTALNAPVPLTAGFALTVTTLPKGTHSLTAIFTPTDPAAYAQSTSSPVPLTVSPLLDHVRLR